MTTYASVRLDGLFLCRALRAGILQGTASPVVCFAVTAGAQEHPVWALDRLAFVVYAYCQASRDGTPVEVSLEGTLVSNELISIVVANRVQWHTARKTRMAAERMIAGITLGKKLPDDWPITAITLPVSYPDTLSHKPGSRKGHF